MKTCSPPATTSSREQIECFALMSRQRRSSESKIRRPNDTQSFDPTCSNFQDYLSSMGLLRLFGILSFWVLTVETTCYAFVAGFGAIRPSLARSPALSSRGYSSLSYPMDSSLKMGVLEAFITDRDDATRKKENDNYLAELQKRVDRINTMEQEVEDLDDIKLQEKTKEFRNRLAKGEDLNGPLLEEAFSVVREAAWYVLGLYLPSQYLNPADISYLE